MILAPAGRAPDSTVEFTVTPAQAQIYRLSGDYNPLHIDPDFAQMSGFKVRTQQAEWAVEC